jgi:hypothetical protein
MGARPIQKWEADMLLTSLEYRGNDASGVAVQRRSGRIACFKWRDPAAKFVHSKDYTSFMDAEVVNCPEDDPVDTLLVHTRKATKGVPSHNPNNHPLYLSESNTVIGGAIVHNGQISNDDALFSEWDLKRSAETDSDIIRAIIDKEGITKGGIKRLNRLCGSVAAACIHPDFPQRLMLLRSGNPCVVGATKDKIYWASDKRTIYRVSRPWVRRHGLYMQIANVNIAFIQVYEDSAWIIGPKGFEFHDEFKSQGNWARGYHTYTDTYKGDYQERQARFDAQATTVHVTAKVEDKKLATGETLAPQFAYCPNTNCKDGLGKPRLFHLSDEERKHPLWYWRCRHCKTHLGDSVGPRELPTETN